MASVEPLTPAEIEHLAYAMCGPEWKPLTWRMEDRLLATITSQRQEIERLSHERIELIALVKEGWEVVQSHYPHLKSRWDQILAGIADGSVPLDALDVAEATVTAQSRELETLRDVAGELRKYVQHNMLKHAGRFGEDCDCGLPAVVKRWDALADPSLPPVEKNG